MSEAYRLLPAGACVRVKARPACRRLRPSRFVDVGEGEKALEISVAAPPEDGKANQAIIEALASLLGVRAAAVSLKTGAGAKLKLFEIEGDPQALAARFEFFLTQS